MSLPSPLACFASTAPGVEGLLAAEVVGLGLTVDETEPGGVSFGTGPGGLANALLQLRTANRVTVRLAAFRARSFGELERHAAQLDWSLVVPPGAAVHFRVTSKKSRLYHHDGIAERLERSVAVAVGSTSAVRAAAEAEAREGDVTRLPEVQRFVVRVFRDEVTISADASGALLHRRGWRQEVARAPLRETLAAAMLLGAEWRTDELLFDPFAGSGTVPIEAALLARRIAPGRGRRFAAEQWPAIGIAPFLVARTRASERELARADVRIGGADRDPGAMLAAIANAERAGVVLDVSFSRATISELPADQGTGLICTNPPYGVRVGERTALRSLYAALGHAIQERRPGWRLAMLVNDRVLQGQVGLSMREVLRTINGGIPVRMVATMGDRR